jgi:hypothetical protein
MAVRDLLAAAGHPPVTFQSITEGQSDFSVALSAAAATHPDLLYIAAYGTEAGQLARQRPRTTSEAPASSISRPRVLTS